MTNPSPANGRPSQKSEPSGLWQSVALAWELGYLIAIPAVVLGFGGAYLDRSFDSSPLFLLIGFACAALLSGIGVYRKVKSISHSS